jgi:hypothetical protein
LLGGDETLLPRTHLPNPLLVCLACFVRLVLFLILYSRTSECCTYLVYELYKNPNGWTSVSSRSYSPETPFTR